MGRAVLTALAGEEDIEVAFAVEAAEYAGREVDGVVTVADEDLPSLQADVWVDVSLADAAVRHAEAADELGVPLLVGATGFDDRQQAFLENLSTAHILAPNLSLGINLLAELAPVVRRALGEDYDVAVSETHHRHKLDAPSGTARLLARRLEEEGGQVQTASLRAGEIVGEHEILFAAGGERIRLSHSAESRQAFARGVAPAVRFLAGREDGAYTMADVLGISF
jgi:4-hydroxy-tetrahydrodipicolinate reductase